MLKKHLDLCKLQKNRTDDSDINKTFNIILGKCINTILDANNRLKTTICVYSFPPYMTGHPYYDYEQLIEYVSYSLIQDGCNIERISEDTILISWDNTEKPVDPYEVTITPDVKTDVNELQLEYKINKISSFDSSSSSKKRKKRNANGNDDDNSESYAIIFNHNNKDIVDYFPINSNFAH